jgi:hypothetical protein
MSVFTKIFGRSGIQEMFKKSITLKLKLKVFVNKDLEISINGIQLTKKASPTQMIFDFENDFLFVEGALFEELFSDFIFRIIKINHSSEPFEVFFTEEDSSDSIVMKCSVNRNNIVFQCSMKNWYFKISDKAQFNHLIK